MFTLSQGVTRECVVYNADTMAEVHSHAERYDLRVEHLCIFW